MIRSRSKTQYAVVIEKETYHVAAWTLKKSVEEAMDRYYEEFGHPQELNQETQYLVKVTNVTKNKTYEFSVAARLSMVYEIKKES